MRLLVNDAAFSIAINVLGLCVVVELEPQKLNLLLMLNRITNLEVTTEPAITQNGCYR